MAFALRNFDQKIFQKNWIAFPILPKHAPSERV